MKMYVPEGFCPSCMSKLQYGLEQSEGMFYIAEMCFCGKRAVDHRRWPNQPTAEFALRLYTKKK